jgi:hypothetical protein
MTLNPYFIVGAIHELPLLFCNSLYISHLKTAIAIALLSYELIHSQMLLR